MNFLQVIFNHQFLRVLMPHNYTLVVKAKDCSFRFTLNLISVETRQALGWVYKFLSTIDAMNYDKLTTTVEAIVMMM